MGELEIRPWRPGDEAAIVACWNDIFPRQGPGVPERDLAWWRWFYLANPAGGEPRVLLAWDGDRVVGQYAGCPLRAAVEGLGEGIVVQAVDLMVRPEYRRRNLDDPGDQVVAFPELVRSGWRAKPQRPGLFVFLGRRYYERWCGPGGDLMTYGYAVPAWRMGARHLGYEVVETTAVLFRELRAAGFRPHPEGAGGVAGVEVEGFGPEADALWAGLRPSFRLAVVRDAAYLNWRYRDRPGRPYRLFLAREEGSGRPRGIAVFRRGDFVVPGAGLLVEWLAGAEDEAATAVLLGLAERAAQAAACPVLAALLPAQDPRFLAWQRRGFLVAGTPYVLGVVTFYRNVPWLRDRWYYTLGDSDLA